MSFYQKHFFICCNERPEGKQCCQNADAMAMRDYAKERVKELNIAGAGGIRVNMAGCMGRCAEGPTIVIYPEGVWYTYKTKSDIDEIINEHLVNGKIVERLLMD